MADSQYKPENFIDFRIPPTVADKIGTAENIFDTILLILTIVLFFIYGLFWILIWFLIAVPIFVVLIAVTHGLDFFLRIFKKPNVSESE